MKTPYDAAIRVRRHEIDEFGRGIRQERDELSRLDSSLANVEADIVRETRLAAAQPLLAGGAYAERMQARRKSLVAARASAEARLALLRERAAEAVGVLQSLEVAAGAFQETERRRLDTAEQAALDDISGSRIARAAAGLAQGQLP